MKTERMFDIGGAVYDYTREYVRPAKAGDIIGCSKV
jgi:hypothetical protein